MFKKKFTLFPKKLHRSFSAQLIFFILSSTTIIFVVAFWIFYHFSSQAIERNARTESEHILKILNLQIEQVLRQVEMVPDNLARVIARKIITPDSLYGVARNVVLNNADIYGCAIAFEPYYFKEKGYYFSPYAYRDGDIIRALQLGNPDYDYFSWEWYKEPKRLKQPCWSEPYYDKGSGQMILCTYSVPVFDNNRELIGVCTADISLDWLSDLIDSAKCSDRSFIFMLGEDGTYILHNLRERILNKTVFDIAEQYDNPELKTLGENMIAGKQGMQMLYREEYLSFVFYAPVPHTNWSLAILLPTDEVFRDLRKINWILLVVVGLGLSVLFFICYRTIRSIAGPLSKFASSAREIAHGDFNAALPNICSTEEMKELYDSFSYLQSELGHYIDNLKETTSIKEKIESEIRIARSIQMGMLRKEFPTYSDKDEFEIYAVLNPAKEVGGDLYDFIQNGDKFYFAIGDVSGKGIPASILMAITLSILRSLSVKIETAADAMNRLNISISGNNLSNMFITLLIGVVNLKTGVMRYCNAGHNPPVLVAPDGDCRWLEMIPNIPVGVLQDFVYQEQTITLPPASTLILYTDGIIEAENAEKELYGNERFLNAIQKNYQLSAQKIIKNLLSDVNLHVKDNETSDDITMMVMKFDTQHDHTLLICNKIEELNKASEFIKQIGEPLHLPPTLIMKLNLALEEAIANIIHHAYKDYPETEQIEIVASFNNDNFTLKLTDNGAEFDPTRKENPDINLSPEERPIGGLGVFLMKQIMDNIEYERKDDKNILIMSKKIININK